MNLGGRLADCRNIPISLIDQSRRRGTLSPRLEGIVITGLNDTTLCNTFKGVIAEIKQEMMQPTRVPRSHGKPVGRPVRATVIADDFVELSPFWCDFAESALAVIPAFVIGRTKAIPQTMYESQKADFVFRKILELEGIHIEAKQDVVAQYIYVRVQRIWFCIPIHVQL